MLVSDFDFDLPGSSIAQEALPRGTSRLFCLDEEGDARHRTVADLPDLLRRGDLLVVNDTRVIPARLFGQRRPGGGRIELLLAEPRPDLDPLTWDVLLKPGRRSRPGTLFDLAPDLWAEVLGPAADGRFTVRFSEPIEPRLEELGHVPLPPYIKRSDTEEDRRRYQTIYADAPGAIAAPTAGLHFDDAILANLEAAGIRKATVTLHVGIGTFKPVIVDLVHEHVMDRERYEIPAATVAAIEETRRRGGRVVAVGTTVVRTLESAAAGQATAGQLMPGSGSTELFVYPGFRFQVVDTLLTNFHLPASTLLMMVCAFAGQDRVLAAYREAVAAGYRFYSYGDAMLVDRLRSTASNP
ncbi:MAG: tRNA preQ1(34) S-adenosylmethionine ribosyltransferase-isomerase QueA [Thermoanaerobaculia bacterium]|nr:tRNA preQ1(34) S-adenosylmethionine ribosyltransferase-isomerase QueA [Thermoanaerobaculia bacterium]